MRYLLCVLVMVSSGFATITSAQAPVNNSASAFNFTLVMGSNVTANNLIAIGCVWDSSQASPEISSITDTQSTTYNNSGVFVNDATNLIGGGIWWGIPSSSGADTITVNFSHSTTHRCIAHEYANSLGWNASPFDQGIGASGASGSAPNSGNFSPVGSDDLLFAVELDKGGATHAQGTGWTLDSTAGGRYRSEYQLDKAAGTYTADWASNATGAWTSIAGSFKTASGTATCTNFISQLGAGCK